MVKHDGKLTCLFESPYFFVNVAHSRSSASLQHRSIGNIKKLDIKEKDVKHYYMLKEKNIKRPTAAARMFENLTQACIG